MLTAGSDLWFLLSLLTLGVIVAVLYTLARQIQHEREITDLRIRVVEVRKAYAHRLAGQQAGEVIEVEPVDDAPAAESHSKAA